MGNMVMAMELRCVWEPRQFNRPYQWMYKNMTTLNIYDLPIYINTPIGDTNLHFEFKLY